MTMAGDRIGTDFRGHERAPEDGLQSDRAEVVLGHAHPLERLASLVADQEIERPVVGGDRLERRGVSLPVLPVRRGPATRAGLLPITLAHVNQGKPIRLVIWRRCEQDPLDQAEHGRGRPDAEGERDDGDGRKSRVFSEHTGRDSQITKHSVPSGPI